MYCDNDASPTGGVAKDNPSPTGGVMTYRSMTIPAPLRGEISHARATARIVISAIGNFERSHMPW